MILVDRRLLLLAAAIAALAPTFPVQPRAPDFPPQVLFVCQFGTVKSSLARELLRRRAAERGVAVRVASRGITPEAHLAPQVRDALAREGIDLNRDRLRQLSAADMAVADIVIAFDPLPPTLQNVRARNWSDTPSVNNDYPAARRALEGRIEQLLDEFLAAQ